MYKRLADTVEMFSLNQTDIWDLDPSDTFFSQITSQEWKYMLTN
jgi:hypothetical protein